MNNKDDKRINMSVFRRGDKLEIGFHDETGFLGKVNIERPPLTTFWFKIWSCLKYFGKFYGTWLLCYLITIVVILFINYLVTKGAIK